MLVDNPHIAPEVISMQVAPPTPEVTSMQVALPTPEVMSMQVALNVSIRTVPIKCLRYMFSCPKQKLSIDKA